MRSIRRAVLLLAFLALPAICPPHIGLNVRQLILPRMERSIGRHENCRQWNNPGCLVYVGQPHAYRGADGYARFLTERDGRAALERDLIAKLQRGLTVVEIVQRFNSAYLPALLEETHLSPGDRW